MREKKERLGQVKSAEEKLLGLGFSHSTFIIYHYMVRDFCARDSYVRAKFVAPKKKFYNIDVRIDGSG